MDNYQSKNHSKHSLTYHIIFVVKYLKKLLVRLGNYIKEQFLHISACYNFEIEYMEVDKDHIHLLVRSEPKVSVLSIVRVLKSISTRKIWKDYYGELRKEFWYKNMFWSRGYFVCSIGNVSYDTVLKYIKEQG